MGRVSGGRILLLYQIRLCEQEKGWWCQVRELLAKVKLVDWSAAPQLTVDDTRKIWQWHCCRMRNARPFCTKELHVAACTTHIMHNVGRCVYITTVEVSVAPCNHTMAKLVSLSKA